MLNANTKQLKKANSKDMEYALELVSKEFGVNEGYLVTSFTNKQNSCKLALNSQEYNVTIEIKNKEAQGFPLIEEEEK